MNIFLRGVVGFFVGAFLAGLLGAGLAEALQPPNVPLRGLGVFFSGLLAAIAGSLLGGGVGFFLGMRRASKERLKQKGQRIQQLRSQIATSSPENAPRIATSDHTGGAAGPTGCGVAMLVILACVGIGMVLAAAPDRRAFAVTLVLVVWIMASAAIAVVVHTERGRYSEAPDFQKTSSAVGLTALFLMIMLLLFILLCTGFITGPVRIRWGACPLPNRYVASASRCSWKRS